MTAAAGTTEGPGSVVGFTYRIDQILGVGGMGTVFAATDLRTQASVAIKTLLPAARANPEVVKRFLREGEAAARLNGRHAVRILDVGALDDGTPYIAMERLI